MNVNNKKLLSRLMFLGLFVGAVFLIFWIGRNMSDNEPVDAITKSESGKSVLIEYADFQCPACGMYYPLVKQLKTEFGDKLEVVYKHFPLKNLHKNADLAARASEAALNQGKFQEMHNMLFEKQEEWSDSNQALSLFTAYAVTLGLDKDRFLTDIDSDVVKDKVNEDYAEGVSLRVNGTPTFFLNDKKINNPRSYDEFRGIIEQSLK